MKKTLRRAAALALAVLMTLTVPAAASEAIGDVLSWEETALNQGTTLATGVYWSSSRSDFRTENLIVWKPSAQVRPVVTYGSVLTDRMTLSTAAKQLEAQGLRVVGGINGDFYDMSNGLPVGVVITDGVIRSSDDGLYAVGFRPDGSAILGRPSIRFSMDFGYKEIPSVNKTDEEIAAEAAESAVKVAEAALAEAEQHIDAPELLETARTALETAKAIAEKARALADEAIAAANAKAYAEAKECVRGIYAVNKARNNQGIFLYTYDFNKSHTTGNTQPGVDVLCTVEEGSLSIGSTVRLRAEQVIEASSATPIGPNQVVISANLQAGEHYTTALRGVSAGSELTLTITAGGGAQWNEVTTAMGALYSLAENGKVTDGLPSGANPRTALGQRADGTLLLYTIDGRKSGHSIGASLAQVGARMIELGCVTVIGLDGGGSTTIAVTEPDEKTAKTINVPSEGTERAVTNHLFLVADNTPTGELSHFYLQADNSRVLAGSRVNLSVTGVDTAWLPMEAPYELSASAGTLEGNTLITPPEGGDITVTAASGGAEGTLRVRVIQTPEAISIRSGSGAELDSLKVAPGSETQLRATAASQHQTLHADDDAFTWAVSGEIGTIGEDGVFTALTPGSGTITLTAGERSVSIPVTVTKVALQTAEDFESALRGEGSFATLTGANTTEQTRYGRYAGKLTYDLSVSGVARWRSQEPIATLKAPYSELSMWVYGDESGNTISLLCQDQAGQERTVPVTVLDYAGWRQVHGRLDGAVVTGFAVSAPAEEYDAEGYLISQMPAKLSGAVYLDQLVLTYDGLLDNEPPQVKCALDQDGWRLLADVRDETDGVLPKESITVTYNGKAADFTYNASTGRVTFPLPESRDSAETARVSVTARDASGNLGRDAAALSGSGTDHAFRDIEGNWAADYIDFLYRTGIDAGYTDGTFRPGQAITRVEFARMLFRASGLRAENYASVALPYADAEGLDEATLSALRALFAEGIMTGTTGQDGLRYLRPNESLTRAQASAMIGRSQGKGYAAAELTFSDAAQIPSYALYYIQTMVSQGILGGYSDGTFRPGNNITRGQMAKIIYFML